MSIDGVVLCDCVESGKAKPPPCPIRRSGPYVVLDADGSHLFAAREFVQEFDGLDWTFRDEQTGATVRHSSPVGHGPETDRRRWRAEIRPVEIDHYLPGVADLRSLLRASAGTGQPVHWI